MDGPPNDGYHQALASSVRQRALELLTDAGRAFTAAELAVGLNLHVTTVRFHLNRLERVGLVRRETVNPARRGRPSVGYRARRDTPVRIQEQLIAALAAALAEQGEAGNEQARRAGWRWAEQFPVRCPDPTQALTEASAVLGFDPEPDATVIRLRACPFYRAAQELPEVVCQVHLGMAQRIVAASPEQVEVGLSPFAEPGTCLLTLVPSHTEGDRRTPLP